MSHSITWKPDSLYRKFTGEISGEEILESNFSLQAHPNFKNIKYIINDFLEITGHSIAMVHTNAYPNTDEIAAASKGTLKIALVFTKDSCITQAAKNYRQEMLSNSFICENFNTVKKAQK